MGCFPALFYNSLIKEQYKDVSIKMAARFTKEQITFLENNVHTMTHAEMAEALGRSVKSIHNKCSRLGLNVMNMHGWSKHPLYQKILDAISRVTEANHPGFDNYKDKEIEKDWLEDPIVFIVEMIDKGIWQDWMKEKKYEIDRKDNSKGYIRGNIRFVPDRDNSNNRDKSISRSVKERCFCAVRDNESPTILWEREFKQSYTKKQIQNVCNYFVPIFNLDLSFNRKLQVIDALKESIRATTIASRLGISYTYPQSFSHLITLFGYESAKLIAIKAAINYEAQKRVDDVLGQLKHMFQEEFNESFDVFSPANTVVKVDKFNSEPAEDFLSIGV